jgi:ferredoxin-type protein NapG
VSFATVTALSSLVDAVPSSSLVRPPGALQAEQFVGTCIRCRACVDVCPVRGISVAHIVDGVQNVGTPVLSGYCMVYRGLEQPSPTTTAEWKTSGQQVTCYECINQCPSGALRTQEPDQLRMGTAVVDRSHCLFYVRGVCGYPCARTCPFEAIAISDGPQVDETKCVGCGQCDFVCLARVTGPTGISVKPRQK